MADAELKAQEEKVKAKYGRLPAKKKGPLGVLGRDNRKFFDSADYAQGGNKATGKQIATPANIVHATAKQTAPRVSLNQDVSDPAMVVEPVVDTKPADDGEK
eukprot:m.164558 g.164558  ORF g.164558 m.164558 type:complete len:102 (+) comp12441_c0_seq1:151-456(+)